MRITTLLFCLSATLPALMLAGSLRAQQLDPSFHPPVLVAPAGATGPSVSKVVRQADGRYLIAGSFESVDGHPTLGLARLLPDGHVDPSFTSSLSSGRLGYSVVLAVQPDGAVLLGQSDTTRQASLQRLLPTGQPDPSFTAALRPVRDGHRFDRLLVQPDGKLLLAGATTDAQGRAGLLRLLPSGAVDAGFTPPTLPVDQAFYDVALEPTGKLLYSRSTYQYMGPNIPQATVQRLLPSGQADPSFSFTPVPDMQISRLAAAANGSYALGGLFNNKAATRLLPSGAPDPAFPPSLDCFAISLGFTISNPISAVAVLPDGRVLAAGSMIWNRADAPLLRSLPQGGPDLSFDPDFIYTRYQSQWSSNVYNSARVYDLLVEPSGKVLVAGSFAQAGGLSHSGLARLLAAAPLAATTGAEAEPLRAWPAPARGQLNVALPAGKAARELSLLDATGRVVLRHAATAGAAQLLRPDALPAGLYVLRVSYADGSSQAQRVALEQ